MTPFTELLGAAATGDRKAAADFLDIGSREAVDVVLHQLTREGTIRRLDCGAYDFPKEHPVIGTLSLAVRRIRPSFGTAVADA